MLVLNVFEILLLVVEGFFTGLLGFIIAEVIALIFKGIFKKINPDIIIHLVLTIMSVFCLFNGYKNTMDLYKIKKGDVCVTYSDSIQYVLLLTNYTKYNGAIIQGTKDDFTIDASAAVSINKYNYFRGNKAPKGFIQGNGFRYDNRTYLDICNPETGEYHVLFMDIPDRSISEYKFSVIGYIDPEAVNGSAE